MTSLRAGIPMAMRRWLRPRALYPRQRAERRERDYLYNVAFE